jgi:phosphatidylglycerophosphate synthase
MSARAVQVVIDARPRGPQGPLAVEVVLGQSVLGRLLDLAVVATGSREPVVVHARADEHALLRATVRAAGRPEAVFKPGPPSADAAVLRTDRLYDLGRLRRVLRQGRPTEIAAVWRLDRPEGLKGAADELTRRLTYQPLGRYWAFPLARRLAEALCPTPVRPNALTLATGALMLSAAGVVAAGGDTWTTRTTAALLLATGLVLDTADGRLARLQGTCSAFGRWLDQVLDELADLSLHAAIAWAAFTGDSNPAWLGAGMLYVAWKYMFLVQSLCGSELERGAPTVSAQGGQLDKAHPPALAKRGLGAIGAAVRALGHADLRWHFWIALAVCGRLEWALAVYAAYFPARALAGAVRKGVRHA